MKKIAILLLTLIMIFSLGVISFAEGTTNETTNNVQESTALTESEKVYNMYAPSQEVLDGLTPEVSIDDASAWTERKGFEIIGFFQKFAQPFSIIIFMLSAFVVLVGAFGNGQLVGKGVWGMAISLIMYAVVLYAPEIMDMFLAWVRS